MAKFKELIQWQTISGDEITIGQVTVRPQSQALTIRWPYGGLVWNRPVAILVQRGEQWTRIPIVDVTRTVQLGLLGLGLILAVIIFVRTRHRRK